MICLCASIEDCEEGKDLAPDQEAIQQPRSDTETEHICTCLWEAEFIKGAVPCWCVCGASEIWASNFAWGWAAPYAPTNVLHCIPELNGLQVKSVQNTAEYYVDV